MRRLCGPLLIVVFLFGAGYERLAWGGPFEGQIRLAPESTNLMVLVNVQALHNTPLAKSEEWMQKIKDAYLSGHALVPPTANRLVMLAEVDPLDNLRPIWDLSVIDLYKAPDVLGFARKRADLDRASGWPPPDSNTYWGFGSGSQSSTYPGFGDGHAADVFALFTRCR